MTGLYLFGGGSLLIVLLIWLYARSQKALGSAESQAESEKQAREVEDGMAEIGARDITDDDLLKSFRDHEGQ